MSLLSRVFSLYRHHGASQAPEEDFFTEIVAQLFSTRHDLLLAWVQHLGLFGNNYDCVVGVSSQQRYDALEHHRHGSRPDIVIHLEASGSSPSRAVLFIESKLLSKEHSGQLRRYAEHLATKEECADKALLYFTRAYDPKDPGKVLGDTSALGVRFRPCRWYELYRFLKAHTREGDQIEREILKFMEEQGMAQDNEFTAVDILAMTHIHKSLNLMDSVLMGEVSKRFDLIAGKTGKKTSALTQLVEQNRYLLLRYQKGNAFWCGIAFNMGIGGQDAYPHLTLHLGVPPQSPCRKRALEVFRDIATGAGWSTYNLSAEKAWSGIYKATSMKQFLQEPDHVTALQNHFLGLLDELSAIKAKYGDLPWRSPDAPPEPEDEAEVGS